VSTHRAQRPIEERNYGPYYIAFAGFLFLGTMWAVVDEVITRRPWKDVQREYQVLALKKMTEEYDQAVTGLDSAAYMDLSARLAAAQDSMSSPVYTRALSDYDGVLTSLAAENRRFQFAKSRGDEAYYFYKKSLHEGEENPKEKDRLARDESEMASHQQVIAALEKERDSLLAVMNGYRQEVRKNQNAMTDLRKKIDKWDAKVKKAEGAPIEIRQVMLLDYDKNPFNDPKARIDRCQTCHQGWNEDVMADAPKPFTQHPLPALLALHKPEVMGCTPCHRGQGPALTAADAHGDGDPFWENPLLKGIDVWSSCTTCHENQSHLDGAPVYSAARRLVIESGCFGCHEIKGYTDMQRIGPELGRIGHKTSPEWIFRWVRNPKDYNAHTRMPNFRFTDDQAEAVTAYLVDLSSRDPFTMAKGAYAGGNAAKGKEIVESVGCLACHSVGDQTKVRALRGSSYDIAPELTRVGSKVTPDWIYDWIRNPRHYNPTTKMPNLRLTEGEARDVTAYLSSLKDGTAPGGEHLNLSDPATVKRGEGLIREYGCAGCHLIPGMEKESRVSVSLSNFGRKRVEEMDFGDTKVPHTWHDWVSNKLKNSRVFQTDRIVQKMPVFAFSDDEIARVRLFLLSLTKDQPDPRYVRAFDAKQQQIEAGRKIAYRYNCQQCHQLENEGRFIAALIDDPAFLPPIITGEGQKVQEPWLRDFLKNPSVTGSPNTIRPWLKTRMPTFSLADDEISALTKYFLGLSNQELEVRDYRAFQPDPVLLPVGKSIFTDFQCIKCHPSGNAAPRPGEASTSDLAPNLTKARDRLKPEWIVEWLADPNKLQEGTRMPTFFPDGQSPLPDVLGGDARKQMKAIRDYVESIGLPARLQVSSR
jgi:cbb3-type cytochrome oxidase cytochrome c subunit